MSAASKKRTSRVTRTDVSYTDSTGLNSSGNNSVLETSRAEEKDRLTGLNSRLAGYIDKVRSLEQENNRLTVQIRDVEVVEKKERANLSDRFEHEKARMRRQIEALEKEKNAAILQLTPIEAELKRLKAKQDKLERDLEAAIEGELQAKAIADEANAKQNSIQNRLDKLDGDNLDLIRENKRLTTSLNSSQKALEDEVLQRTQAQNDLARALEDLEFANSQHKSAIEEVRHKRQVDMTTYQKQVSQEYQSQLQDQLAEMRAQFQAKLDASNGSIEDKYRNKLNEAVETRDHARSECAKLRSRVKELEFSAGSIVDLRKKLQELEEQMNDRLADKDQHINELNSEISRLLDEFQNLRDSKIQLDAELDTYKMLLESEEERLNLTGNSAANTSVTHHASFSTSGTGNRRGVKRSRLDFSSGDHANFDYRHSKEKLLKDTTGPVGIDEVDPEGKWVSIINSGSEEISVAKWSLAVRGGEKEVVYQFNAKMKLAPGATCTVYSASTGHKAHAPASILMKSENWPVGENPSARLLDAENDVVSTISLESSESTDPSDPSDRCTIM